jgi:glutamate-ammonia-ligase adenylyltransferase
MTPPPSRTSPFDADASDSARPSPLSTTVPDGTASEAVGVADGEDFHAWLADEAAVRAWLRSRGVKRAEQAVRDLRDLASRGRQPRVGRGLLAVLDAVLPRCGDPDAALTHLDRFVAAHKEPDIALSVLTLDLKTTEILLQLFGTSYYFAELLIHDPDVLPWLRGGAERLDRGELVDRLAEELAEAQDDADRLARLRRFRHRHLLRIGYADIVKNAPLEVVAQDLSHLADACVEAALRIARGQLEARHGVPRDQHGRPARFAALALGKLGGGELNYSSDIDLMFIYDGEGNTTGSRPLSNAEFFERLAAETTRLLSDSSRGAPAYRVDLRLRPDGATGPLVRSLAATLGYYETVGRTWERQALIKCRPVAGDLDLGHAFLTAIEPFVYRRHLNSADIGEIKAMKRRIERRAATAGTDDWEVKTGRGGIRDVEFVVQFLQLLHGGTDPSVRHPNTLIGLARLHAAGCLQTEERRIMEETYRFLRRVEHRLQTMFNRQTHELPRDPEELRALALRMAEHPNGPDWADPAADEVGGDSRPFDPGVVFLNEYRSKTRLNRKILDHLLHDAFPGDGPVHPVVDLVLDPDPPADLIASALGAFPFRDPTRAAENLARLAREDIPFLSQARCRHFLAAIAPRLLEAVGTTPDPDQALANLERVSASLGAKAVLWELFNHHPPSLSLYVELCAVSPLLSEVLISNPGMIDDLMDSLVDDRPRSREEILDELKHLALGAEDLGPILASFRNKEWVRVGVREILGREPVRVVCRELADAAEAVLMVAALDLWQRCDCRPACPPLGSRYRAHDQDPSNPACPDRPPWAILALGKLGGRELSYHGDLDVVFLFEEADDPAETARREARCVRHAQQVMKFLAGGPDRPALYEVDPRLRPFGSSGPLALPLRAFAEYHLNGTAQGWERLALTRARVLGPPGHFVSQVETTIRHILTQRDLGPPQQLARLTRDLRDRIGRGRPAHDLKRGLAGTLDVEFIVQYLQLRHGPDHPNLLVPNLWDALDALRDHDLLSSTAHRQLTEAYDFLRALKNRVRLVHHRAVAALPESVEDWVRLARRPGTSQTSNPLDHPRLAHHFRAEVTRHAEIARDWFDRIVV